MKSRKKLNKQPEGWHKEDIKAAIRKKGETMVSLATKNDIPTANVRNALIRPVLSGEIVIAEFLGVSPHSLWPDRWTPEGQRIRPRYAHLYAASIQKETPSTSNCNGLVKTKKRITAQSARIN